MGVQMEPPSPNREYNFLIHDTDHLSDEEIEWRMNTKLYCQNCHKLWKPWVFINIITNIIVWAVDSFCSYDLIIAMISFVISAPICFFINAWQIYDNNKLRDIYNVNSDLLRMESRIEMGVAIGAGISSLKTIKKSTKHALTPHDVDI
ncbi:MAG: hypothetical protein MJZ11_08320 [Lachnospiraceae bacterium]|nr:hypothetical protein [Lachnospiraceae bacterium]